MRTNATRTTRPALSVERLAAITKAANYAIVHAGLTSPNGRRLQSRASASLTRRLIECLAYLDRYLDISRNELREMGAAWLHDQNEEGIKLRMGTPYSAPNIQ